MTQGMASATTRKPKPKEKAAVKGNHRKAKKARQRAPSKPADPLADIDEPDRSAPPLAEVDAEALAFIAAIDRFKKEHARPFPSWSEILLIVRQLGYKRG